MICLEAQRPGQDAVQQHRLIREIEGAPFHAGHDQQVLDEPEQPLRLGGDVRRKIAGEVAAVVADRSREHLAAGIDRRDRRPELVGQDSQERLALGPCLARAAHVTKDRDTPRGLVRFGNPARRPADGVDAQLQPSLAVAAKPQLDRPVQHIEPTMVVVALVLAGRVLRGPPVHRLEA
jgi:hypothetical protein